MRIEFRVEGRLVTVEAAGAVSVRISEEEGAGCLGADMAARLLELRKGLSQEVCIYEEARAIEEEAPGEAGSVQADAEGTPMAVPEPGVLLMERLVGLRRELAAAEGVPTYVVFHDRALHQMVERLPQDLEAFKSISGVGKTRLEKYGERFLAVIREGVAA